MTPHQFVSSLQELEYKNAFNPYKNACPVYDLVDAPSRRSAALLSMLSAASNRPVDSIWIGRDLGHRGGRRTGMALTDDVHMADHGKRWDVSIERPTKGEAVGERTAAVIWSLLSKISSDIFLWNVFPLHPHEAENPFSNRSHNSLERKMGEEILCNLINIVKPKRLIAIGNDAASTIHRVAPNLEMAKVRHPSYGGQNQFIAQMHQLYCVDGSSQGSLF